MQRIPRSAAVLPRAQKHCGARQPPLSSCTCAFGADLAGRAKAHTRAYVLAGQGPRARGKRVLPGGTWVLLAALWDPGLSHMPMAWRASMGPAVLNPSNRPPAPSPCAGAAGEWGLGQRGFHFHSRWFLRSTLPPPGQAPLAVQSQPPPPRSPPKTVLAGSHRPDSPGEALGSGAGAGAGEIEDAAGEGPQQEPSLEAPSSTQGLRAASGWGREGRAEEPGAFSLRAYPGPMPHHALYTRDVKRLAATSSPEENQRRSPPQRVGGVAPRWRCFSHR